MEDHHIFSSVTSSEISYNVEIVLQAVTENGMALEYADSNLQGNYEIVATALNRSFENPRISGWSLRFELQNDRDIVEATVQQHGLMLQYASPELRKDRQVVHLAVQQDGLALYFADPILKDDPDIVCDAIKQNPGAINFASEQIHPIYWRDDTLNQPSDRN